MHLGTHLGWSGLPCLYPTLHLLELRVIKATHLPNTRSDGQLRTGFSSSLALLDAFWLLYSPGLTEVARNNYMQSWWMYVMWLIFHALAYAFADMSRYAPILFRDYWWWLERMLESVCRHFALNSLRTPDCSSYFFSAPSFTVLDLLPAMLFLHCTQDLLLALIML